MTEQEFIVEAKKRGIREDNILEAIESFKRVKEYLPNITLEETIETTLEIQNKIDNESDEIITVD